MIIGGAIITEWVLLVLFVTGNVNWWHCLDMGRPPGEKCLPTLHTVVSILAIIESSHGFSWRYAGCRE